MTRRALSTREATRRRLAAAKANKLPPGVYRVSLAGVVSKYVGEIEKRLGDLFMSIERTGAVLFFDEADALFGKRTDVGDAHDRHAGLESNYRLQSDEGDE